MPSISKKPATKATKAALTATLAARKIQKKTRSKKYKTLWLALKRRLARSQTGLSDAIVAKDDILQKYWTKAADETLTEMRTFADYRYTNTAKMNGV